MPVPIAAARDASNKLCFHDLTDYDRTFFAAMFERLRAAFSQFSGASRSGSVTARGLARWAAAQQLAVEQHDAASGHFALNGHLAGHLLRLECGPSTRDYVQGLELLGRADVGADPDAAVLVLNRQLHETLEDRAYDAITNTLQTTVNAMLPEEVRWLALFEEMAWPGLPTSFRRQFVVVAERMDVARRWVHAPLVSQLLDWHEANPGEGRAQSPLLLMLVRGKVHLRMERTQRSLGEAEHALQLLRVGAQAALQNLPPMSVAGPDDGVDEGL